MGRSSSALPRLIFVLVSLSLAGCHLTDGTAPEVESLVPEYLAAGVPVDAVVTISFSQPMDREATEAAFSLEGPSGSIPGTFAWLRFSTIMTFTPDASLEPGRRYELWLWLMACNAAGGLSSGRATEVAVDASGSILLCGTAATPESRYAMAVWRLW